MARVGIRNAPFVVVSIAVENGRGEVDWGNAEFGVLDSAGLLRVTKNMLNLG